MSFQHTVSEIDNYRFQGIITSLELMEACPNCALFNLTLDRTSDYMYSCANLGKCPGVTLSVQMLAYLNLKLNYMSYAEYKYYLGP